MTIKTRITIWFAITVASILLVFSVVIYYSSVIYRQREFYKRLKEKAENTAHLLLGVKEIGADLLKIIDKNNLTVLYQEEVTIFDLKRNLIYDSGNDQVHISDEVFKTVANGRDVWFIVGDKEVIGTRTRQEGKDYVVIASAIDKWGINKMQNLELVLMSGWAVSVVVIIGVGYIFAARALEPISDVVEQVERISESNLSARVRTENNKDEIAHLANTFNRMMARLEEAFTMNKSFVSNASHELRTPLTAITGQIEVILMQNRTVEDYRNTLQSVLEDIKSLNKLSNGLLDLTQASADIATIKISDLRIDELLWTARTECIKAQPENHISIDFEEMPDSEDEFSLVGNEHLLKTAFINLMENGCKFSADHQVWVSLRITDSEIVIAFTDHGVGISEKDLKFILEPFFRAENVKNIAGHGIGLSLTNKIILLHKGNLAIQSTIGKGTTFTVSLPKPEIKDENWVA